MHCADGSPYSPPENPLTEKWSKLYPPCPVCDLYGCIMCNKCPKGSNWMVPEEYLEAHQAWLKEWKEYDSKNGPVYMAVNIRDNKGEES